MPRIDDTILRCTFYVYDSEAAAKVGEGFGATGFLASIPCTVKPDSNYYYAITNSHVIRKNTVLRFNTKDENFVVIRTDHTDWVRHPAGDDVAALALELPTNVYYASVPISLFTDVDAVNQYTIGPGDEAVLVGRFVTHEGKQQNLPTARFGNISMLPWEPVLRTDGVLQESFLVEYRSLPGYSGSPVFLDAVPHQRANVRKRSEVPPFLLLGTDWGHLPRYAPVLEKDRKTIVPEGWTVEMNSGMACVVPAWKIKELLEVEEFSTRRNEAEKNATK